MNWLRRNGIHLLWVIPGLFLLETAIRRMAEPDLFFYYALIEYYLRHGSWPHTDPFVYTLPHDVLMTAHQWLGYWIYYLPYRAFGWAGPILLKAFFVTSAFLIPFVPMWRARRRLPTYFVLVWSLALLTSHHRFRERVSLFGDLLTVGLVYGLFWWREKRWFWWALPPAFLLWAQLHPSWPLGWAILIAFFFTHRPSTWRPFMLVSTALCFVMPLLNPLGLEGLLYPFSFARHIEPYLSQYVVEWLPLTDHRLFPFRFLYVPFFTIIPFLAWRLWMEWREAEFFEWLIFALAVALNVKSVRFGLMAQVMFLLLIVRAELRSPLAYRRWMPAVVALLSLITVLSKEYQSGSWRVPITERLTIETNYFPEEAVNVINRLHPRLHIFNSFGFGGYLAWRWQGDPPIFFHGFSTNFDFYEKNYNGPQYGRAQLDEVIRRYDIGVFLLSKLGNDNAFIELLRVHPDWQLVREDNVSVLFFKRDPRVLP